MRFSWPPGNNSWIRRIAIMFKFTLRIAAPLALLALGACSDQSPVAGRAPEAAPLLSAGAGAIG